MRVPAVLVLTVYLAALAVALREPSEHLLAGAVVLLAVLARPSARSAISRAMSAHPVRDRRSRAAAATVVAPVTPG